MKDILIGIQLWCGNKEIDFSKFSFDFLEIDLETLTVKDLGSLNFPEKFAFHAPHSIKFSHINENVERVMLKELKNAAILASEKGAEYINYHFNFQFYGLKTLDAVLKEKAKQNVLSLLRKRYKCEILFENLREDIFSSDDIFSFLISNKANLCLDIGHLALQVFNKEKDLKKFYIYLDNFMESFGNHVKTVHLHNVALNKKGILVDHTLNGFLDIFRVLEMLSSYEIKFIVLEIFSLNAERIPFDYSILENFANKIRKKI